MPITNDWDEKYKAWKAQKDRENNWRSDSKPSEKAPKEIKEETVKIKHKIEPEVYHNKPLNAVLIAIAFIIPILFLGYALYVNFHPLGYEKSYEVIIGENGTVSPILSEIFITNTAGRKILSLPNGVLGQVNLVVEPKFSLKNATANISIEGDGVSLGTPIDFNPNDYKWDYKWNFTNGIPANLNGTAQFNPELNCAHFDAVKEQTLYLPNTSDMFESGPMSIYVKWKPSQLSEKLGDYQQIIGHFNWEVWQGKETLRFQIGRMNDANGTVYSINYPISKDFFDKEHDLLALYFPDIENGQGYIEFYIDNKFAGRESILNETIYKDYNSEKPLSMGWSPHNYEKNPYFDGCIYDVKISNNIAASNNGLTFYSMKVSDKFNIPIIGNGNLTRIKVDLEK